MVIFFIFTEDVSSISIFLCYHIYFTFSKRFYSKTIVVIKKYFNGPEYFKLILWIVLAFITALFGESFIFLMVFNPLFAFSLVTANLMLFFFTYFIDLDVYSNFL